MVSFQVLLQVPRPKNAFGFILTLEHVFSLPTSYILFEGTDANVCCSKELMRTCDAHYVNQNNPRNKCNAFEQSHVYANARSCCSKELMRTCDAHYVNQNNRNKCNAFEQSHVYANARSCCSKELMRTCDAHYVNQNNPRNKCNAFEQSHVYANARTSSCSK